MINRINTIAILLAFALIGILFLKKSNDRIVYVDSARLLNQYQGMIEARKTFEQKAKGWQANVDTLTNQVQRAIRDYERSLGQAKSTTREKELARQLIQTRQRQLAEYQQAIRQTAQSEESKGNEAVLKVVNSFLAEYGKKKEYDLVLVANQSGNIAYATEGLDVTDEVIQELNKAFKK